MKTKALSTHIPANGEGLRSGPYKDLFQLGLNIGAKIGRTIDQGIDAIFESIEKGKEVTTW